MAISIDYGNTFIIDVELEDLTLISGTLYEFNVNDFRLILHSLQDGEEGIIFPKTHRHNTTVTIVGSEFDRTFEILPPYSVRFPDQKISVKLISTNNNVFDVEGGILVQNQCQVIPNNSAGKTVDGGGDCVIDPSQLINWDNVEASIVEQRLTASLSSNHISGVIPSDAISASLEQPLKAVIQTNHIESSVCPCH